MKGKTMKDKRLPLGAKIAATIIFIAFLFLMGYLGYKMFFSDNAVYGITIPFIVGLVSLPISKYIETRFERSKLTYEAKRELYTEIFDFYHKALVPLAKVNSNESKASITNVADHLLRLNGLIVEKASDEVLLMWIEFNRIMTKKPFTSILKYAEIMYMMRIEMGHKNKDISATDLLIPIQETDMIIRFAELEK